MSADRDAHACISEAMGRLHIQHMDMVDRFVQATQIEGVLQAYEAAVMRTHPQSNRETVQKHVAVFRLRYGLDGCGYRSLRESGRIVGYRTEAARRAVFRVIQYLKDVIWNDDGSLIFPERSLTLAEKNFIALQEKRSRMREEQRQRDLL